MQMLYLPTNEKVCVFPPLFDVLLQVLFEFPCMALHYNDNCCSTIKIQCTFYIHVSW